MRHLTWDNGLLIVPLIGRIKVKVISPKNWYKRGNSLSYAIHTFTMPLSVVEERARVKGKLITKLTKNWPADGIERWTLKCFHDMLDLGE